VQGCEIIPQLFQRSRLNLANESLSNVRLYAGDFLDVLPNAGEFDLIIGTSCFSVLHSHMLDACSPREGHIVLPVEVPGGGDCLTFFVRHGNRLEVTDAMLSLSVPTTGKYSGKDYWASPVRDVLPRWAVAPKITIRAASGGAHSIQDTLGFRSFLLFTEALFTAVNLGDGALSHARDMAFGLVCPESGSGCLRHGSNLIVQGPRGLELAGAIRARESEWRKQGKPTLADYRYSVKLKSGSSFAFSPAFCRAVSDVRYVSV
jgi:hypothetical protein